MSRANLVGIIAIMTGVFLIWAGIKNQNPVTVLKQVLTGAKTVGSGSTNKIPSSKTPFYKNPNPVTPQNPGSGSGAWSL